VIHSRILDDSTTVISARGSAGGFLGRRMESEIFEAVRRGRQRVIVDLSMLEAPAPGLLGALLRSRRLLLALGGQLCIVTPGDGHDYFGARDEGDILPGAADLTCARAFVAGAPVEP
jgi:hypothetical protein